MYVDTLLTHIYPQAIHRCSTSPQPYRYKRISIDNLYIALNPDMLTHILIHRVTLTHQKIHASHLSTTIHSSPPAKLYLYTTLIHTDKQTKHHLPHLTTHHIYPHNKTQPHLRRAYETKPQTRKPLQPFI